MRKLALWRHCWLPQHLTPAQASAPEQITSPVHDTFAAGFMSDVCRIPVVALQGVSHVTLWRDEGSGLVVREHEGCRRSRPLQLAEGARRHGSVVHEPLARRDHTTTEPGGIGSTATVTLTGFAGPARGPDPPCRRLPATDRHGRRNHAGRDPARGLRRSSDRGARALACVRADSRAALRGARRVASALVTARVRRRRRAAPSRRRPGTGGAGFSRRRRGRAWRRAGRLCAGHRVARRSRCRGRARGGGLRGSGRAVHHDAVAVAAARRVADHADLVPARTHARGFRGRGAGDAVPVQDRHQTSRLARSGSIGSGAGFVTTGAFAAWVIARAPSASRPARCQ